MFSRNLEFQLALQIRNVTLARRQTENQDRERSSKDDMFYAKNMAAAVQRSLTDTGSFLKMIAQLES